MVGGAPRSRSPSASAPRALSRCSRCASDAHPRRGGFSPAEDAGGLMIATRRSSSWAHAAVLFAGVAPASRTAAQNVHAVEFLLPLSAPALERRVGLAADHRHPHRRGFHSLELARAEPRQVRFHRRDQPRRVCGLIRVLRRLGMRAWIRPVAPGKGWSGGGVPAWAARDRRASAGPWRWKGCWRRNWNATADRSLSSKDTAVDRSHRRALAPPLPIVTLSANDPQP